MKINCIIKNTKVLQQLELLVGNISNKLIGKDILPTPTNIFNEIRNLGVEIDLSTVGAIYANNLSGTDTTFMTVTEVSKEVGADFNNTLKKIIQLQKGTKEIGKRSPAEAVAAAIANIFVDRNTPVQARTLMRGMQDIMLKGLKRHIPGNPVSNSVDPFDIARAALDRMANLGVTDIRGQLNSLRDVFADVKIELDKQIQGLQANGAPAATIAKYEEMIEGVQNSIYQLLLSKTEAKGVINQAIKKFKNGIFTKTDKSGNVELNYDALSGHVKSEQDLRDNVNAALSDAGFDPRDIAIIENSLAQEFKDAYANILQKAINKLNAKQAAKGRPVVTKSDLERLAQLQALGAFGGAHEKMIYELLGLQETSSIDLNEVEAIAQELNAMRDLGFIEGNDRERQLNQKIDNLIAAARYRDAGWFYKTVKVVSDLFSMANLAILNNIKNRTENYTSGALENFNSFVSRGGNLLPKEIRNLASATKKDIVNNGGLSYGEMDMLFQGDSSATERVREKLGGWISQGNAGSEKVFNWVYNQMMGTAALNGIDSYNKVKNTWSRFIGNMETILIDKGLAKNKKEAQRILHEKMFGDKWTEAEDKAKALTDQITANGSVLKSATPEMITRLAADIVKAELVNNNLITQEELEAAWNASYKAAGRALGHVSNNWFSTALQSLNNKGRQNINKQLDKGNYNYAAGLALADLFINKMILKFAGGGTNWVILNVEKTGLGLVLGGIKKGILGNTKHLADLAPKDIEEELYRQQVQNDKIARGTVGLVINALMFFMAYAAFGGEEDKKRRKAMLAWTEKNKWANKYLNVLPMYVTAYLAVMKQKNTKEGMDGYFNLHKYSPLRNFIDNFTNRSDTYSFDNQIEAALAGINSKNKKTESRNDKQKYGWEKVGQVMGNYFNFDPLPYRPIKDLTDIVQGIAGAPTKSDRDNKERGKEAGEKPSPFYNMTEGYFKYGLFDW